MQLPFPQPTPKILHGFPLTKLIKAKMEARPILIEAARRRKLITYSEMIKQITSIRFNLNEESDRSAFGWLLSQVSLDECAKGRPILAAIVVRKGDMRPGPGFYKFLREIRKEGPLNKIWLHEIEKVWKYWSSVKDSA